MIREQKKSDPSCRQVAQRSSDRAEFGTISIARSAPEVDYPRAPLRRTKQKRKELKQAITGISFMVLITFWIGLAGALEGSNINMGQFLLSTLLLAVIGSSVGAIFRRSER